jgi:hypothetical protein
MWGSSIEIEAFTESLERLFGSATPILEIYILKRLYSQAGRPFQEKSGCKFVDYINEVKTLMATGEK